MFGEIFFKTDNSFLKCLILTYPSSNLSYSSREVVGVANLRLKLTPTPATYSRYYIHPIPYNWQSEKEIQLASFADKEKETWGGQGKLSQRHHSLAGRTRMGTEILLAP